MPRSACSRPAEKAPGSPYTVGTMLAQPHHVEHQRGRGWTNSCLQIQRAAAPSHPQPLPRFSQDGRSAGAQHADVYSLPGPKPNRQVDLCLEKQAGLRGRAHGQHHAESAKEKFGTDVGDTRWLLPFLLQGAAAAKDEATQQLVAKLRRKKCVTFVHMVKLLEGYRAKDTTFGNEHLSLQTNVCKINIANKLYRNVIPMEKLSADTPPELLPLAHHLGVDFNVYPYPHSHQSASQTKAAGRQRAEPTPLEDLAVPPKIQQLMLRLEAIAREDVAVLSELVGKEYSSASAKAARHLVTALQHDNGIDET